MINDLDKFSERLLTLWETRTITLFFIIVGVLTVIDIVEDWEEKAPLAHIIPEAIVAFLALGIAVYIIIRLANSRRHTIGQLRSEWLKAKESAQEYQTQIGQFKAGVTEAISNKLNEWRLTVAEQEVCLFLLKGFSLQEIADLRGSAERTIRQQASDIYKKSGLSGRAELSAFFLEDLLI